MRCELKGVNLFCSQRRGPFSLPTGSSPTSHGKEGSLTLIGTTFITFLKYSGNMQCFSLVNRITIDTLNLLAFIPSKLLKYDILAKHIPLAVRFYFVKLFIKTHTNLGSEDVG